ncbi:uncharacterized protein KY384_007936 [Bacidia gigantensis]|uniref:uncharacterized protein n=1 Tax=Bacidia gigantensis TaxID=2732470 RepID=UPI001D0483C5|nr:uncharacterized protein KY384_007936 [Bacidia gigantensis]KAG8527782.1 hypothetical protein KY384_007936 [Bacidia gigantensis]
MMKAVRFHGKEDIRIDEIPIPVCGKGQVKVKPAFAGICGSGTIISAHIGTPTILESLADMFIFCPDLHEFLGGASLIPVVPHPITNEQAPLTLGHEFSGTIKEVGEGVDDIKVGDRVTVQPIIYDGTCAACKEGYINCCESNGFVGLSGWGGGLSEYCVVPRASVYTVPESIPLDVAAYFIEAVLALALVEPLAVGWHAVKRSPFKKGDAALVLGGGPIGLAVILALKAKGADNIIVSEIAPMRKDYAKQFGADHVVDPSKEDIVVRVKEICGGVGVNIVYDAAGVQPALDAAILALRARGTFVNIAVWEKKATIWPRERTYMGITTYLEGDYREVLDAIESGSMQPGSMITKKIKMADVVEEGFKCLINEKDRQVKVMIDLSS